MSPLCATAQEEAAARRRHDELSADATLDATAFRSRYRLP
jgi:hypothetical protein